MNVSDGPDAPLASLPQTIAAKSTSSPRYHRLLVLAHSLQFVQTAISLSSLDTAALNIGTLEEILGTCRSKTPTSRAAR